MKKIIIISVIIVIIITIGLVSLYEIEESIEEKWLREQVISGPFAIDKSQYNIGEKIFITVNGLPMDEKGSVMFFRPLNNTSWSNYISMEFNGKAKSQFNLYFEPKFSEIKNICSMNDLAGTWVVKFMGTEYSDITFEMLNQTASWDTRIFEPIC